MYNATRATRATRCNVALCATRATHTITAPSLLEPWYACGAHLDAACRAAAAMAPRGTVRAEKLG